MKATKPWQRMALLLVSGGVLVAIPAYAQESAPPPPPPAQSPNDGQPPSMPPPPPEARGMNVDRRADMLQARLNLTSDQAAKVKAILVDEQTKMEAMRSDPAMQGPGRRDAIARLRGTTDGRIVEVLNSAQQKKYAALQDEMQRRMQERRQGRQGGPPPPPPPPPAGAPPQQ